MRSITDLAKLTEELVRHVGDPKKVAASEPYPVNTYRELVSHVAQLAYKNKDYLLFYRGQHHDYRNKGGSSTFYPSIYRDDPLARAELRTRFDTLSGAEDLLAQQFAEARFTGAQEITRKKYVRWSILQHYEVCRTPLLDFTHSIRVGCSFAVNENTEGLACFFVFGLPYITNRISINSEHDLVNVRLLSICPPTALRPYFQEGYLAGTEDITADYQSKTELDFNNRLIAKFSFRNDHSFWGADFSPIPSTAIYPEHDDVREICLGIKEQAEKQLHSGTYGEFLRMWAAVEQSIVQRASDKTHRLTARQAIILLQKQGLLNDELAFRLDRIRKFRNQLVHNPASVRVADVPEMLEQLTALQSEIRFF